MRGGWNIKQTGVGTMTSMPQPSTRPVIKKELDPEGIYEQAWKDTKAMYANQRQRWQGLMRDMEKNKVKKFVPPTPRPFMTKLKQAFGKVLKRV